MAIDAFLDFTQADKPIKGEAQDDKLKDNFHVKSFSFGVAQKGTASTGTGLGAGKAEFEDFEFTIDTQKGSPEILKHCAAGTHFNKVFLHVRKAGGNQVEFLTYRFEAVIIASFNTSGEEESTDTVKFNYRAVFSSYIPQKDTGDLDTAGKTNGGWDLKLNKELTA